MNRRWFRWPTRRSTLTDVILTPRVGPPGEGPGELDALKLRWIIKLRWHATAAQAIGIASGARLFELPIERFAMAAVLVALVVSNLALGRVLRRRTVGQRATGAVLLFDVLVLTVQLLFSGAANNPFVGLYFVLIVLAALVLEAWRTRAVSVGAFLGHCVLVAKTPQLAGAAAAARLVAFGAVALLLGYFVERLVAALREHQRARDRAEKLAARTEKLASLSTLTAGVAHELATPLGSIAIASRELLALVPSSSKEARDEAEAIRAEVERCRHILQRLGYRSGQSLGEAPMTASLAQVVGEVRVRLGSSSHRLILRGAEEALVTCAVGGLVAVLVSLVENALQASEEPSPVELTIDADDQIVRIAVRDRGCGVAAHLLERVGEPFFTTKPAGSGMGLGVFLSRSYAEAHGGAFAFASREGEGTTVSLTLPRALRGHDGLAA